MSIDTASALAWRQAIETGQLGVWDLHLPLQTVHHSPKWKELLGFPNWHDADATEFWRCRVHPEDLDLMLHAIRAHVEGRTPSYEFRFRLRSNGSGYRLVHSRGRVVERDRDGHAVRMVGTMIDLTDRPFSPRTGLVEGAPHRSAVPTLSRPFHVSLLALSEPQEEASARASSSPSVKAQEPAIALVLDLLEASIAQLRNASG